MTVTFKGTDGGRMLSVDLLRPQNISSQFFFIMDSLSFLRSYVGQYK